MIYAHWTIDAVEFFGQGTTLQRLVREVLPAGPEDILCLPDDRRPQELPLLRELGIGPREENIRTGFQSVHGRVVHPFSGSSFRLHEEAQEAGVHPACPSRSVCLLANSKGVFQDDFGGHPAVRIPKGFTCGAHEVHEKVAQLLAEGIAQVRIKPLNSASGIRHQTVASAEFALLQPGTDRYVVQEEIGELTFDASVQFTIREDGQVLLGEVVGQIVGNQDGCHAEHGGNFWPFRVARASREENRRLGLKMRRMAEVIATEYYQKYGFWGTGSVDFIGDHRIGMVLAVEVNARITAPWYPIEASRRWHGGELLPFDMKSFSVPAGFGAGDLERQFRSVLYRLERRMGFIPFSLLSDVGFCYGVVYAPTLAQCEEISSEVERLKRQLVATVAA